MRKNKWIIWLIIGLFIYATSKQGVNQSMYPGDCTSDNCIDYGNSQGTIQMAYGTNEDGSWYQFSDDVWFQTKTQEVNTKYIRTWLSAHWYRDSTFPLNPDGTYTWTNVDKFVDAVLASGAKPFILFAHGDKCGRPNQDSIPFDFSQCEGHGIMPPSDFNAFGDYAAEVTFHFVDRYGLAEVNTWYFEILNEPYGWSDFTQYYELLDISSGMIKEVAPGAKVGGYAYNGVSEAVSSAPYDFVDRHFYPGNIGYNPPDKQSTMNSLNGIYNEIVNGKSYGVEIVSGEYNMDDNAGGTNSLGYEFQSDWLVGALINQIKAGASMELWYEGTYGDDNVWGLWNVQKDIRPAYYSKKMFTENHPYGSTIYANSEDTNYDIFATGDYVTILNKGNSNTLSLEIKYKNADKLTDLNTNEEYNIVNGFAQIPFAQYDSRFFRISGGGFQFDCDYYRTELGNAITNWIGGTLSRDDLGVAIQDWVMC